MKEIKQEELNKLSNKQIIDLAEDRIKEEFKNFSKDIFEIIKIIRKDETQIIVDFRNNIDVFAKNTCLIYSVSSWIGKQNSISYKTVSNPENSDKEMECEEFFKKDKKTDTIIKFVTKAINSSDKVGTIDIDNLPDDFIMDIREEKDYFWIVTSNDEIESRYKIDKKTKKIYDASHKHMCLKYN